MRAPALKGGYARAVLTRPRACVLTLHCLSARLLHTHVEAPTRPCVSHSHQGTVTPATLLLPSPALRSRIPYKQQSQTRYFIHARVVRPGLNRSSAVPPPRKGTGENKFILLERLNFKSNFDLLLYIIIMATFNRKSSFAAVVKSFTLYNWFLHLDAVRNKGKTNHIKEFYNCRAAFSAERSRYLRSVKATAHRKT